MGRLTQTQVVSPLTTAETTFVILPVPVGAAKAKLIRVSAAIEVYHTDCNNAQIVAAKGSVVVMAPKFPSSGNAEGDRIEDDSIVNNIASLTDGSDEIIVTTTDNHNYSTGDTVFISANAGTAGLGSSYVLTRTAAKTFTLDGSSYDALSGFTAGTCSVKATDDEKTFDTSVAGESGAKITTTGASTNGTLVVSGLWDLTASQ